MLVQAVEGLLVLTAANLRDGFGPERLEESIGDLIAAADLYCFAQDLHGAGRIALPMIHPTCP